MLIAGGKDKGFTFETLRPLVTEKVRVAILIGEMADEHLRRIGTSRAMRDRELTRGCGGARPRDRESQAKSSSFLPGTSSFDMFKSYADRGDQFRALVQALPK